MTAIDPTSTAQSRTGDTSADGTEPGEPAVHFPNSTVRHGTHSGWTMHTKAGERPCDPCFFAKKEYDRRRLTAPDLARKNRLRAKAQMRAYAELARRHHAEYRVLYEQIKAAIFADDEMAGNDA